MFYWGACHNPAPVVKQSSLPFGVRGPESESSGFIVDQWVFWWDPCFIWFWKLNHVGTVDGSEIPSPTTWDVWNLVNNGINYQPQLVSLPDFWTINRVWFVLKQLMIFDGSPTPKASRDGINMHLTLSWLRVTNVELPARERDVGGGWLFGGHKLLSYPLLLRKMAMLNVFFSAPVGNSSFKSSLQVDLFVEKWISCL